MFSAFTIVKIVIAKITVENIVAKVASMSSILSRRFQIWLSLFYNVF